jgi:hypothetical protein
MLNTNTKNTKNNKNGKMTSKLLDKLEEKQNRSKRFRHMLPSPNVDIKIKRDADHDTVTFNDDYDEPLNKCLKSFIIVNENENVVNTSSSSYSSSTLKMITCKICLNKFYDDVLAAAAISPFLDDDDNDEENKNANNNKLPVQIINSTINKLYQLESCKCKFCQNVSCCCCFSIILIN